jgi:hypothetical protein
LAFLIPRANNPSILLLGSLLSLSFIWWIFWRFQSISSIISQL